MNAKVDYSIPLEIGYPSGQCWETLHRPNQRIVYFVVSFEELQSPPDERDYRICLRDHWLQLLNDTGLSASIYYHGWHPDNGPLPSVIGWVWRQHGSVSLGSLSEDELFHLSDYLRSPHSKVTRFVLTEQFTTLKHGHNNSRRKIKLGKRGFLIEQPPEQDLTPSLSPTNIKEANNKGCCE